MNQSCNPILGYYACWNASYRDTGRYITSDHCIRSHPNMIANLDWSDDFGTCANVDVATNFYAVSDGDLLK